MAASMKQINFLYRNYRFTLALDDVIADRLLKGIYMIKRDCTIILDNLVSIERLSFFFFFPEANYLNEFFKNLIGTYIWPSLGLPNDLNIEEIKLIEDTSNIENDTGKKDQNYSTKKRDIWTDAMIRLLISERLAIEEQFGKPGNKKKLWIKIKGIMESQGYTLTAEDCDMKWRNLLATYRKNKDRARKSGEGCITWPYFQLFDEKYGYKTNISPPAETLLSSLSSPIYSQQPSPSTNTLNSSENSTSCHNSPSSSNDQNDIPKPKKPKLSKEEPPAWFKKYVEDKKKEDKEKEEREERHWREFQKMEEEKLCRKTKTQVMKELLQILKK
ncbi:uncharacterized protein [Centruroides vittatus]|uniref:uncharacterized protein n=1 Tax=Centruroides vittatus TaxID=120091 RepID=UPI00350FC9F9